jgi:hypothetical protein
VPAAFLHQVSEVVLIMHFFVADRGKFCIKFSYNLASKLAKNIPKLHLLVLLFESKIVRNISTKASIKSPY